WFVRNNLHNQSITYADDRLFCTGGSGGGNVTLMCNKLAPRTFACVIDMCGMKKLSDDIAFAMPGGSDLNARWSRDPASPNHLKIDEQELRFVGHPLHLAEMKRLCATSKILVVHGVDDRTCPFEDAVEMVDLMKAAGLDVEPHFITKDEIDGKVFSSTGHSLGDRTQIALKLAGKYLKSSGEHSLRRSGDSDFDRRESIRYLTGNGGFVISYDQGFPVGRFEPAIPPPEYKNHHQLLNWLDADGQQHVVTSPADWEIRRTHIRRHLERVMGTLPSPLSRVPLNLTIQEEVRLDPPRVSRPVLRRRLTYQSDAGDRVPCYVMVPLDDIASGSELRPRLPAVLCLQQTTTAGKDEPAGIRGDADLKYALELAERGFVTLAPDYPSFGEHTYDFSLEHGYSSGSMKAVWDNIRAIDLLETMSEVDATRIGCIGHSLGGHNAIFTAVFEPRIKVIVSSCGFTSLAEDDIPSWTGPRYMPRIASVFNNDVTQVPFDFHELIGSLAPRPFLACAAEIDDDFAVSGVRDVMKAASHVYRLHNAETVLQSVTAPVPHSFPLSSREQAYAFLREHLTGSSSQ
ncbi:MAG: alpha/beta fold hydrolase, partial [Planctomycetota bacterium]|nr:alpha/beta fold hydrolase [Planctomycetota bacterium]